MNTLHVTKNGSITYDFTTQLYTVLDETFCYTVGETQYRLVAKAMLEAYCKHYLGDNVEVELLEDVLEVIDEAY